MKHILYIIIIGTLIQSCSVGRRMERKGDIIITPSQLELRADQSSNPPLVDVSYAVTIPKGYISRSAQFIAIPYFKGSGYILPLTPIYVSGRKFERLEKRHILFGEVPGAKAEFKKVMGRHPELRRIQMGEAMLYENAVKIVGKRKKIIINMRDVVAYQPWMSSAELVMPTMVAACRNITLMNSQVMASGVEYIPKTVVPKQVAPPVKVEVSKPTVIKNKEWKSYVDFEINSYKIVLTFNDNQQRVDSLNMVLKRLASQKGVTITKVNIMSYSSPDGALKFNQELAEERAIALKNYIIINHSIDPQIIKTATYPADWNMLRDLIAKSDMSGKANVLKVLDGNSNYDIRNALLKKMPEYTSLRDKILPQIRKSTVEISYKQIVD